MRFLSRHLGSVTADEFIIECWITLGNLNAKLVQQCPQIVLMNSMIRAWLLAHWAGNCWVPVAGDSLYFMFSRNDRMQCDGRCAI